MRHARWLKTNPDGGANPELAIYHVVSRVVDRGFVLGADQKELGFKVEVRESV